MNKKILNAILKVCDKYPHLQGKILVIINVDAKKANKIIKLILNKLKLKKIHEDYYREYKIIHFA